jgi:DnaJ-class molecular chaperone
MTDFAWVNDKPGKCGKCNGTGTYRWGAFVNGRATHEGTCYSCRGTGEQTRVQMRRNSVYNNHKLIY